VSLLNDANAAVTTKDFMVATLVISVIENIIDVLSLMI
jgi:hypothetical protein